MLGELTKCKTASKCFESISAHDTAMFFFHFSLFSVLLLGYHGLKLSAGGGWRVLLGDTCWCQPITTLPAVAKSFFFSLFCVSQIIHSLSILPLKTCTFKKRFCASAEGKFSQRL